MFDPIRVRGYNKYGMPRGQGQQNGRSIYLDQPLPDANAEQELPAQGEDPMLQRRRLAAALTALRTSDGQENATGLQKRLAAVQGGEVPPETGQQQSRATTLDFQRFSEEQTPYDYRPNYGWGQPPKDDQWSYESDVLRDFLKSQGLKDGDFGTSIGRRGSNGEYLDWGMGAGNEAAAQSTPPAQLARPDSSLGGYYTGFDWNKDYDTTDSAKGTFFYSSGAGAQDERWKHADTAPAWFDQYVRPQMEQMGYQIDEVKGDKAFVHTRENPEGTWIDWVVNIDGDPSKGETPQLAWQDLSYGNDGPIAGPAAPTTGRPTGGNDEQAKILAALMGQGGQGSINIDELLARLLSQNGGNAFSSLF